MNHPHPQQTSSPSRDWSSLVQYGLVILIAVVLGASFSAMDLFKQTVVIKGKLSAAELVEFLGLATALAAFWLAGRESERRLRGMPGRWAFLQHVILPLVSLIVVAMSHSVSLLVLKPVLSGDGRAIYNWLFIIAILACAAWLVLALLGQTQALGAALSAGKKACLECGAGNDPESRYCRACGKPLGA